jgi:hypothetical protein
VQGDAPEIMDAALAGHNAFLAGEPEPAPAATKTSSRAATRKLPSSATSTDAGSAGAGSAGAASTGAASTGATPSATLSDTTLTDGAEPVAPADTPADADAAPTAALPDAALSAAEAHGGSSGTVPPPPPVAGTGYTSADGTVPPGAGYPRTVTDFADRLDDTRFFSTLFDFSFTSYVTRKLAGPVYVVGLVLIGLSTLLSLIYSLTIAVQTHSFFGAFVFLFGLIITLVGTVLAVLLLRVGIEVFVAIIEIAQNTRGRKKERP